MKKKILILIFLLRVAFCACAQAIKPEIDADAIENWESVQMRQISSNGHYAYFETYVNDAPDSQTLIATDNSWEIHFKGAQSVFFSSDSRLAIVQYSSSLHFVKLGSSRIDTISNAKNARLIETNGSEQLLFEDLTGLHLLNLANSKKKNLGEYKKYWVSDNGHTLLVQAKQEISGTVLFPFYKIDIATGLKKKIWEGTDIGDVRFSKDAATLAFYNKTESIGIIWVYNNNLREAKPITLAGNVGELLFDRLDKFSSDGDRLFFRLKEPATATGIPKFPMVSIWNYKDIRLQSAQPYLVQAPGFEFVVDLNNFKINRLQYPNERLVFFEGQSDHWVFINRNSGGSPYDEFWKKEPYRFDLLNTVTLEKKKVPMIVAKAPLAMAPSGKFLILNDEEKSITGNGFKGDYYSLNIATGKLVNLTQSLPVPRYDSDSPSVLKSRGLSIAGWLFGEDQLLIFDRYDFWKVDPTGSTPAVCLTHGIGRKYNISFGFAERAPSALSKQQGDLILAAFDHLTKANSIYKLRFDKKFSLECLLSDSTFSAFINRDPLKLSSRAIIKASHASAFLVTRDCASKSPNIFFTSDFKKFVPLTRVSPEKKYNWLTSELVKFNSLDNTPLHGVLYKPENFDPKRKYPVIFTFYENESDELNISKIPHLVTGGINIPWFTSRGYLVFTPDIKYTIGQPGRSALNAVVGAANELMKRTYIDSKNMATAGMSWGGFENNYIVTHSNLFKASFTACGSSDLINYNGSINNVGESMHIINEVGQNRLGKSLWEDPNIYIDNSPIFKANEVSTPLLLLHNKNDGAVPYSQGLEFFTALRRLDKKAWMLEYDGEGHGVGKKENQIDLTTRVTQFFDYYLKGTLPPKWMTSGIPASEKGINSGLELDHSGRQP